MMHHGMVLDVFISCATAAAQAIGLRATLHSDGWHITPVTDEAAPRLQLASAPLLEWAADQLPRPAEASAEG